VGKRLFLVQHVGCDASIASVLVVVWEMSILSVQRGLEGVIGVSSGSLLEAAIFRKACVLGSVCGVSAIRRLGRVYNFSTEYLFGGVSIASTGSGLGGVYIFSTACVLGGVSSVSTGSLRGSAYFWYSMCVVRSL
jgi:hypothetical protein